MTEGFPSLLADTDMRFQLYFDASNPERNLSVAQIKSMISKVVAGLKHHGLKKGDSVCVMSLNDVSYPFINLAVFGLTLTHP